MYKETNYITGARLERRRLENKKKKKKNNAFGFA